MQSVESNFNESNFNESNFKEANFNESNVNEAGVHHAVLHAGAVEAGAIPGGAVRRRRFIGSALTLGAGAAIGGTISFPAAGVHAAKGGADLVHEELIRHLKKGIAGLRGARPGEAARSLSSTARILAAHYQSRELDADMKRRLLLALRRQGRETLLRREMDPGILAAEARAFGIDQPLPRAPFDRNARERALDAMLSVGVSAAMLDAANALEQVAPELDRLSITSVAARQSQCPNLTMQLLVLEFIALTSCFLNPIFCAGFQGAYWGLRFAIYLAGC